MNLIEILKNAGPYLIVAYIIILAGTLMLILNLRAVIRARSSINWSKTKGVIIESELIAHKSTGDSNRSFKPRIVYKYQIHNNDYKSNRVYFGSNIMSSYKKSKSQKTVDKYPVNKAVEVFYDKMNEKQSVLEPGIKSEIITGLIFGILFLILGYLMTEYKEVIRGLFEAT